MLHLFRSCWLLSHLLIASVLSLSTSICFATPTIHDTDNEATHISATKTQNPETSGSLFETDILNPFWASLFEALSPSDRNSLAQVSKRTYSARFLFYRTQTLRVTLNELSTKSEELSRKSSKLLLPFKGLVPNYVPYFFEPYACIDRVLSAYYDNPTRPNMVFSYMSHLSYIDLHVQDMIAAKHLLATANKKATVHLSVGDTICKSQVKRETQFFSDYSDLRPLYRKLKSFRVIVDSSDTAIEFLTLWSSLIQIGDTGDIDARPYLQIFVREFIRPYQLRGDFVSAVELRHKPDPRKEFTNTSQPNRNKLDEFEKMYSRFYKFLASYHMEPDENDPLREAFQGGLLKLLSYSDLLAGASYVKTNNADPSASPDSSLNTSAIISTLKLCDGSALNNMGMRPVEDLYKETGDFEVRKEILYSASDVAATTLLEAMSSPIVNAFPSSSDPEIRSKAQLINALTRMPNFFQKSAMKAIMQTAAFREKKMSPQEVTYLMQFLYYYYSENYKEILERLQPLRPTSADELPDWEEDFYDDLKVFTKMQKEERMNSFRDSLDQMLLISPGLNIRALNQKGASR